MSTDQGDAVSDVADGGGMESERESETVPRAAGGYSTRIDFRRHDSEFSVSTTYNYKSENNLNLWQGATLLTADCLGTGILALPHDIKILGSWMGVGFLILNLPINLYAGTILSDAATYVETRQQLENRDYSEGQLPELSFCDSDVADGSSFATPVKKVQENDTTAPTNELSKHKDDNNKNNNSNGTNSTYDAISPNDDEEFKDEDQQHHNHHNMLHHDTATFDFIGMTSALFVNPIVTRWVLVIFYTNIFLVLGDYILVMSHAVSALLGESFICVPQAGVFASTLMFAVSQLRTMAKLGRSASIISLAALFVVVLQCLYHASKNETSQYASHDNATVDVSDFTALRKLSAMGSIGFAVGSQKLFLNIRHELANRSQAPKTLAMSLTAFGALYVTVVLNAGDNPPSFLFDAIPDGWGRRLAGFLLWVHVVVSYAINSQAICSSMDRLFFHRLTWCRINEQPDARRWMILTAIMSFSAFFVANAIPFFKDLVALIGALTSVPLTLFLPAIFHRQKIGVPLFCPTIKSMASFGLVTFSILFMFAALVGALDSIGRDWWNHDGGFFACR